MIKQVDSIINMLHGRCGFCKKRNLIHWDDSDYRMVGFFTFSKLMLCQNCYGLSKTRSVLIFSITFIVFLDAYYGFYLLFDYLILLLPLVLLGYSFFKSIPVVNPKDYKIKLSKIIKSEKASRPEYLDKEFISKMLCHMPDDVVMMTINDLAEQPISSSQAYKDLISFSKQSSNNN